MSNPYRSDRLDLRLSPGAKQTLQAAAEARQTSLSEFVLGSALEAAGEALAERQRFGLDAERWAAFQAALDAPPGTHPRMERLLNEPGVFD